MSVDNLRGSKSFFGILKTPKEGKTSSSVAEDICYRHSKRNYRRLVI